MVAPAEIVYWEILPAIRKAIVGVLKEKNVKQSDIAKVLDITPSAVSQYLKNKRGDFDFDAAFQKEIVIMSELLLAKKISAFDAFNTLIRKFTESKQLCTLCHSKNNTSKTCSVCLK
jgi:predicted transcriptional regulator